MTAQANEREERLTLLWREVERLRELTGKLYTGTGGGGLGGNEVRKHAHAQMDARLDEIDTIVREAAS